jgi:hypothetical protein
VHGVPRAGIRCAIASISLLLATSLRLRATSLDSFRDPTYGGFRNPVRALYWDRVPFSRMELLFSGPAATGLEHGNGGPGQCGHLGLLQVRG